MIQWFNFQQLNQKRICMHFSVRFRFFLSFHSRGSLWLYQFIFLFIDFDDTLLCCCTYGSGDNSSWHQFKISIFHSHWIFSFSKIDIYLFIFSQQIIAFQLTQLTKETIHYLWYIQEWIYLSWCVLQLNNNRHIRHILCVRKC